MKEIVLTIWLGIQAVIDFKHKEISIGLCLWGGLLGIAFCIAERRGIEGLLFSLLPGCFFIIFSKISNEVIGYGDGIIFIVMAFFLSVQQQVTILMIAFSIAGLVALVMLLFFQKRGNYRIPLIPFVFIAFLIESLIHMESIEI